MLEQELASAIAAVQRAGQVLLEVYATPFEVSWKGQSDPVTVADERANALIVAALREQFPSDGIIAEESPDHLSAISKRRIWYVDPLDGTKEFIAKNGEFSVMVGLAIDGEARLGVVYQPTEDKLYTGIVGQGAWLVERGQKTPLQVSEKSDPRTLGLVVSRSHRPKSTETLTRTLGITKESVSGSVGLKVGLIAQQQADLYVHVSDKASAWDACGPEAVLRAAGGRFTDLLGQPFVYGTTELRTTRGILACNQAAFASVLPTVTEIGFSDGLLQRT